MPAYLHHQEIEVASILCPSCIGLFPMNARLVEPHWSSEQIDIIYECPHCGGEAREVGARYRDEGHLAIETIQRIERAAERRRR